MLEVTTDVPAAVTEVLRGRFFPGAPEGVERALGVFELEFAARANRLASFGALTIERQRAFVASRITL